MPHGITWLEGLKRPGREGDHLTPSSAEVRNGCSCTFTLILRLYGVNFTFYSLHFKKNILHIGKCNLGLYAIRRPVLPCVVSVIANGHESQVSVLGLNGFRR
jgi:hypothetical protein